MTSNSTPTAYSRPKAALIVGGVRHRSQVPTIQSRLRNPNLARRVCLQALHNRNAKTEAK